MKARELHPCSGCGGSLGGIFHVIEVDVAVLDAGACRRFAGLTMQLDGHEALASVMGPDEDLAHLASETEGPHGAEARKLARRLLVCMKCQTTLTVYELLEQADLPREAEA